MRSLPTSPFRKLGIVAAVAMLSLTAGKSAVGQTLTKVSIVAIPIDVSSTAYYALAMGFFKQHGLDATITSAQNGSAAAAAIAAGHITFGSGGTTDIAEAYEHGLSFVMVAPSAAYSTKVQTHGELVRADSPIKSVKDLPGKTVAVAGLKTLGAVALHAWMDQNGVDYNKVQFVEMPFGTMQAALEGGRISCADEEAPFFDQDVAAGDRSIGSSFSAIAPEWIEGAYFTTSSYAKSHPEVIKEFGDAIAEASAWATTHGPQAWSILDRYANAHTPPNTPHAVFPERLSGRLIQPVINASAKYGLLKYAFPAKDLFAPGIIVTD